MCSLLHTKTKQNTNPEVSPPRSPRSSTPTCQISAALIPLVTLLHPNYCIYDQNVKTDKIESNKSAIRMRMADHLAWLNIFICSAKYYSIAYHEIRVWNWNLTLLRLYLNYCHSLSLTECQKQKLYANCCLFFCRTSFPMVQCCNGLHSTCIAVVAITVLLA